MKSQNHFLDLIENFSPLENLLLILCLIVFFILTFLTFQTIIQNQNEIKEMKNIISKLDKSLNKK